MLPDLGQVSNLLGRACRNKSGSRRKLAEERKRAAEAKDEEMRKSLKSSEALASIRLNRLYLRLAVAKGNKSLDGIDEEDEKFQNDLRVKRAAAKRKRRQAQSAKKRAEASSGAGMTSSSRVLQTCHSNRRCGPFLSRFSANAPGSCRQSPASNSGAGSRRSDCARLS